MLQSDWTQRMLASLEQSGLIKTGFVNVFGQKDGGYRLEVANDDNDIFELTVRKVS